MKRYLLILLIGIASHVVANAQESNHPSKAWEIGIGGNMMNWNRVSFSKFQPVAEGYKYSMSVEHLLGGGHLYVAREITPWFYLDLQGSFNLSARYGHTQQTSIAQVWMGGLGAQFRFTPLFESKYIEPYLRVGANYLYKNYSSMGQGSFEGDPSGVAGWISQDFWNHSGASVDKNTFIPLSFGAGVNVWMSNRIGLGLQGQYLMPVEKGLPRFAEVSLRFMVRFGGTDKRPQPRVEYVDRVVEKPVERIVERIVERNVESDSVLYDLLESITFDFDQYSLRPEAQEILDRLAQVLKRYEGRHFLLTGHTDACGSAEYNQALSEQRARVIMEELIKRGIPATQLRARGVGKRIAALDSSAANEARFGDRKVTIEIISNMDYWNLLP